MLPNELSVYTMGYVALLVRKSFMAITLEKDGRQLEDAYIASHSLTDLNDTTAVAPGLESYFASVLSSIFCFTSCWRYGHPEEISTLQGAGQRSPMLEIQSSAAMLPHYRDLETRGVGAVGGMEGSDIRLIILVADLMDQ